MVRGDAAEAEQRAGDGNLLAFGEGEDLGFGAGVRDAVPGEDDGLLCGLDEFDGLLDGGGFGAQHASFVMSTSTGPGRPDFAICKASRRAGAMSSARVTR